MPKRPTTDVAATWDELASRLGVRVRRIYELRNRPGSPDSKSVSAWKDWLDDSAGQSSGDDSDNDELKNEKLREDIRGRRIRNDRDEGVLIDEAQQAAREIVVAEAKRLRSVLLGLVPGRLAKGVVGKTGAEIETIARTLLEEALQEAKR